MTCFYIYNRICRKNNFSCYKSCQLNKVERSKKRKKKTTQLDCLLSLSIYFFFTFSFITYFLKISLLLFKYSCVHFPLTMPPYLTHPYLPPLNLPPMALSMCPLCMFLDGPSPIFPHYPLLPSFWLLSVCSFF